MAAAFGIGRAAAGYLPDMETTQWLVVVGVGLGLVAMLWWLWSQPHPDDPRQRELDPTDEGYPPGARPAGPGAETQRPDGRPSGGDGHPDPDHRPEA